MELKSINKNNNTQEELGQQRCLCNKLLCIVKGNNIEIKCNKCKRIMIIKTKGIESVEYN